MISASFQRKTKSINTLLSLVKPYFMRSFASGFVLSRTCLKVFRKRPGKRPEIRTSQRSQPTRLAGRATGYTIHDLKLFRNKFLLQSAAPTRNPGLGIHRKPQYYNR